MGGANHLAQFFSLENGFQSNAKVVHGHLSLVS
jgi:hypothetical protein